jgi:hypothetical protein
MINDFSYLSVFLARTASVPALIVFSRSTPDTMPRENRLVDRASAGARLAAPAGDRISYQVEFTLR